MQRRARWPFRSAPRPCRTGRHGCRRACAGTRPWPEYAQTGRTDTIPPVHDAPVFLIGGGRDPSAVLASHRPFAALTGDRPVACVVLDEGDETDPDRWEGNLREAGVADVRMLVV